jgi:hypothetical protein
MRSHYRTSSERFPEDPACRGYSVAVPLAQKARFGNNSGGRFDYTDPQSVIGQRKTDLVSMPEC